MKVAPAILALIGLVLLSLWLTGSGSTYGLTERWPGADKVPPQPASRSVGAWAGGLETLDAKPADLPGAWPRFRGADFSNVSTEAVPLLRQWPEGGPPVLWEIDVGEGYAGPAVLAGRVYLLDYDRQRQADVLRCLSLADGRDIWRYAYPVRVKRNHGMSRTVPAVTDKFVLGLGPKCHVICLDAVSGDRLWQIDLVAEYGTTVPDWYAGQCPLIDAGRAVIAPGGPDALMIAVDCASGEVLWTTPNPHRWRMTHSSIMPMELNGRRTYVYCASGGVVGVSAEDGKILWQFPDWRIRMANVPSPLAVGNNRVLLTGGYNAGALMLRIRLQGDGFVPEPLLRLSHKVFGSQQHTPILHNGHVYGVRQDGQLACLGLDGKPLWASGSDNRFGLGPFMIADGLILAMDDAGLLALAEATPAGYRRLAQAKVLPGPDAWGPMALAGGRLILRDLNKMICLDLRAP